MTTDARIPATVAILTKNSEATLDRALSSVTDFAEILVCDGNSTDATCAIAAKYGARVVTQDPAFLDAGGRIKDFSGVRNQTLHESTHPWFFFLDADEYIDEHLLDEFRAVVATAPPAAYWVARKYVVGGKVIDCAVTYPIQQMRLFHRSVATRFIKEVHERIELAPECAVRHTSRSMFVPLTQSPREMIGKWRGYLAIERERAPELSLGEGLRRAVRETLIAGLYCYRFLRNLLFCRGTHLPIQYEFARLWYQAELFALALTSIRKL